MKNLPKNMSEIEKPTGSQEIKPKRGNATSATADGEEKENDEETKTKKAGENETTEAILDSDEVCK